MCAIMYAEHTNTLHNTIQKLSILDSFCYISTVFKKGIKMKKKVQMNISIQSDIRGQLRQISEEKGSSMSFLINSILNNFLENNNSLEIPLSNDNNDFSNQASEPEPNDPEDTPQLTPEEQDADDTIPDTIDGMPF